MCVTQPAVRTGVYLVLLLGVGSLAGRAQQINHEGRILPPLPEISAPVLFNTPEADAILAALQVFPVDNAWNERIANRPVHANSANIIAKIQAELAATGPYLRPLYDMNFTIVPANQALVAIGFDVSDESDPAPYPLAENLPTEGWPMWYPGQTVYENQITDDGSDRHALIVDPAHSGVWEVYRAVRSAGDGSWQGYSGARFALNSNAQRPAGWTSADAAGLCVFAGTVRYDECQRGVVEHAIRIVVKHTRREYLYPATHYASVPVTTDPNVPAMGQRLRLKASVAIPAGWSAEAKAVANALKKYGALVADNGSIFSFSCVPDSRFTGSEFDDLRNNIRISDFEVIETTGADAGPRAPGAPTVNAGPDQSPATLTADLNGSATGTGLTIAWTKYAGPGTVTFGNAAALATTATFSAPGTYTLLLSADDGVHAIAWDALEVTVGVNHAPVLDSPAWADPNPVTLPAGTTVHVVASDPDGDTLTYAWTKVSGVGTATFAAPAAANGGVTFSAAGTYVLRVTVTDGRGGSVSSDATVTVNAGVDARADVNHDGVVNALDLQIVIANFGKTVGSPGCDARADANADSVVNALDLQIVVANFGQSVP